MLNKKMKILLYGANLWYLGAGMFGPLLAVFAEKIGGDVLDISWAYAIYLTVTGSMTIIIGKISDKGHKHEKLMVMGYMLNTLCTFGYLLVHSPLSLFVVQAGLGFAAALASPTWEALYAKHENRKAGGYAWGLADGWSNLVTAVAIIAGGFIVTYASFEILFLIMACIQVIATVYQSRILITE